MIIDFWGPFRIPKPTKINQGGLQKRSQIAKKAKRNDFEKSRFLLFFATFFEHEASQESLKTAKKPPKMVPESNQEPFKKGIHHWAPFLPENGCQNCSKSVSKYVQKLSKTLPKQKQKI